MVYTSWKTKSINILRYEKDRLPFPLASHVEVFSFMSPWKDIGWRWSFACGYSNYRHM